MSCEKHSRPLPCAVCFILEGNNNPEENEGASISLDPHPLELFRSLWLELHTKTDPTPSWFADWVSRVPQFCGLCQSWLKKYLETNPPRFGDFFAFGIELHNAVNAKLEREQWTIERAIEHYKDPS